MSSAGNALGTNLAPLPMVSAPKAKPAPAPKIPTMEEAYQGVQKAGEAETAATTALAESEQRQATAESGLQAEQNKYIEGLRNKERAELAPLDQGPFQPKQDTLASLGGLFMLVGMSAAFLGSKGGTSAGANAQAALTGLIEGWNKGDDAMVAQQKAIFDENAKYLSDRAAQVRQLYQDYEQDALKFGVPTAQGRLEQRLVTEAGADVNAAKVKQAGAAAGAKQAESIFKAAEAMENKRLQIQGEMDRSRMSFDERLMLAQMSNAKGALDPDAVDFLSDQYLRTGKLPYLGFSSGGRTQLLNAAARKAKAAGLSGADFAAIVAGNASAQTALNFVTRQAAIMESNERTMLSNMKVVEDIGKPEWSNSMPWLNRWAQDGATSFGNEKVPAYAAALVTVMDNYAKILSGSTGTAGSTDASRAQAFSVVNQYLNTGQVKQIFNVIRRDAANNINGKKVEAQQLMGQISGSGGQGTPIEGSTGKSASGKDIVFHNGRWEYP
jgi:hypothetical protein